METTTITKPIVINTHLTEDGDQCISLFDNGAVTIREFNGKGQTTTYVCLDAATVQMLKTMLGA